MTAAQSVRLRAAGHPLRRAYAVAIVAILAWLVLNDWDETFGSASVIHNRLFVVGTAALVTVMAITYAVPSFWDIAGTWLVGAHLVLTGIYLGLAIGTVDWAHLSTAGRVWQVWWTPPFIAGEVGLIRRLVASQSSPRLGA